jgi:hypothetical protein
VLTYLPMKSKNELIYALQFASCEAKATTTDEKMMIAERTSTLFQEVCTLRPEDTSHFTEIAERVAAFVGESKALFREALRRQYVHEKNSRELTDTFYKDDCVWYENKPHVIDKIFAGKRHGTVRLRSYDGSLAHSVRTTSIIPIDYSNATEMALIAEVIQSDLTLNNTVEEIFASTEALKKMLLSIIPAGTFGQEFLKRIRVLCEMSNIEQDKVVDDVLTRVARKMLSNKGRTSATFKRLIKPDPAKYIPMMLQKVSQGYIDDIYNEMFRELKQQVGATEEE